MCTPTIHRPAAPLALLAALQPTHRAAISDTLETIRGARRVELATRAGTRSVAWYEDATDPRGTPPLAFGVQTGAQREVIVRSKDGRCALSFTGAQADELLSLGGDISPAQVELEHTLDLGDAGAHALLALLEAGTATPARMANGHESAGEVWWGAEFRRGKEIHLLTTGPYGYELFEARDAHSLDRLCQSAGGEVFEF